MNRKVIYKIGILILAIIQILNVLGSVNIVKAQIKEGDKLLLKGDHECDSLVEYWMTDYNKWSYKIVWYVYYLDSQTGEKYPAFCIEPLKEGVGTGYTEYETSISMENDPGIRRILLLGYMGSKYTEWDLECDDDLYSATKIALHSYIDRINPRDKYIKGTRSVDGNTVEEIQRRAEKVLYVAEVLYDYAINGTATYDKPELYLSNTGEKGIEILNGIEYYIQKYELTANRELESYELEIKKFPEGTKILNLNNQEITSQENSFIKLAIPTKNIKESINGEILIKNAKVKTYPIYYCKSSIEGAQSYVTYTSAYEIANANVKIRMATNNCSMQILKIDSETKNPLENVSFEITKENGEYIGEYTTDKEGKIEINNLEPGVIKIKETKADDRYILNNQEQYVTLEWGKTIKIEIQNSLKKGNLKIEKVDAENNEILLENVKFKLYDSNDNFIKELITDEKGEVEIKDLNIGNYYIQEIETNDRYLLNEEKIEFTINWNEETVIKVENKKAKGNIKIIKTSEDDNFINGKKAGSAIQNVVFEIYDSDGNYIDQIITDEDGIAVSNDLELGQYKVKETIANEDYELNETMYNVEITKNEQIIELCITNKSKNKLPRTGF